MRAASLHVRLLTVLLAGAAVLSVAGSSATAKPVATIRLTLTDPITGSWLFTSRRTDLAGSPAATISATSTGFDIVMSEPFKTSAPGGVTFSVAERASNYNDYPECTIEAGTVVGHFALQSIDAKGIRRYGGSMLKAQESSTACALIGLQGTYYAHLVEWSDTAQKPPLADGPYNRLCIDEDPGDGCYVTFDRKGGTAAATPSTTAPASGLVPLSAKIPPDKRFKSDHTPPTVKAVASSGRHGASFYLDYYSKDNRGFAGETYRIYNGSKLVKAWGILAGERDGRMQRAPATLPPSISGSLTFCVGAQDLNRNRSAWSCAPLTIS